MTNPARRLGRASSRKKQEPSTIASSRFYPTMGQSKMPKSFRRSQPARNPGWRPPAFSIGGLIPLTASSRESHKQRMIQKSGDRDGVPTENAMAHPSPTTASFMTTAIFPSLLHEDPRYYQL